MTTRHGKVIAGLNGRYEVKDLPMNVDKPIREPNLKADVETPAWIALIAAIAVMALALAFMAWQGRELSSNVLWGALVFGLVTFLGMFMWKTGWAASTIHMFERVAHIDLNKDGVYGEPTHPALVTRYQQKKPPTSRARVIARWQSDFYEFVDYIYETNNTSVTNLKRRFKDKQIVAYRDWLIQFGIADWRGQSRKEGWEMIVDEDEAHEILDKVEWADMEVTDA